MASCTNLFYVVQCLDLFIVTVGNVININYYVSVVQG